tara:strand:+ start:1123 stop:1866 length:744 start_codon:yes stop_codon:yes gene_type:complete
MKMFSVRNIIFWFSLVSGILFSADLEDFAKDWVGYESLSSPSLNYQGRQIYLDVRSNSDGMESLVYASNSEFIYNGYLDWAGHFLTYNKDLNYISFGRRFYTPLGIIGTQQLEYKILEFDENRLILEHTSDDSLTTHTMSISAIALTSVNDYVPESVSIKPNYPNPFNPSTTIPVRVSQSDYMQINIFDSNGKLVKKLFNGELSTGQYSFRWNGLDKYNTMVSSGIYFCKVIKNNNILSSQKMVLLK